MIDFNLLEPEFKEKLDGLISNFEKKDYTITFKKGFVHPFEQASLWRRSRSDSDIDSMINTLENNKCPFIADMVKNAKPQTGDFVTADLPGLCWHNWGRAVIISIINKNKVPLAPSHEAYREVAKYVNKNEMVSGCTFNGFNKKSELIQACLGECPLDVMKLTEIDKEMEKRFKDGGSN